MIPLLTLIKQHNYFIQTNKSKFNLMHDEYFATGDPYWDGDLSWDSHQSNCGTYNTYDSALTSAVASILNDRHDENIKNMLNNALNKSQYEILHVLLEEKRTTTLNQLKLQPGE